MTLAVVMCARGPGLPLGGGAFCVVAALPIMMRPRCLELPLLNTAQSVRSASAVAGRGSCNGFPLCGSTYSECLANAIRCGCCLAHPPFCRDARCSNGTFTISVSARHLRLPLIGSTRCMRRAGAV